MSQTEFEKNLTRARMNLKSGKYKHFSLEFRERERAVLYF